MNNHFRSAVDRWFYAAFLLSLVITVGALVPLIYVGSAVGIASALFAVLFGLGLPIWILRTTRYEVTDTELLVRCGPFTWRIPRAEIHGIEPSRSMLSSPALSLNRLAIRYGTGKSILVSPDDHEGFLRALAITTVSEAK